MRTLQVIFFLMLLLTGRTVHSQFNPAWQGKKCAVVITYDDAISQHLDHALPVLDSLGLKATFYITAYSTAFRDRLADWKKAADHGHELGNHTLYHPCIGGPGREWVKPEYDLKNYSVKRIVEEIRMTNTVLQAVDGKTQRSFAYTCADTRAGDSSFTDQIKNDFIAIRHVRSEMHKMDQVNLKDVDCYMVNHHSAAQMIDWVKKAMETNSLLVLLFHGVGGGNGLDVDIPDHRELLQFLKQNEKDILVAPMVTVAEHIRDWQTRDKAIKLQQEATQADYKNMLSQLGIDKTRPGPSGNPSAPNAANMDESKASPYTSLPDPLLLKNGKKVTDTKTWWSKKRPELVKDLEKEVYGSLPQTTPKVTWEIARMKDTVFGNQEGVTKSLIGHVDNSAYPSIKVDIQLSVTTPKDIGKPVPVILEFGFNLPAGFRPPVQSASAVPAKSWQEQVLEKGWGFAIIIPTSYQADNGAGLTQGIIGLCNKGQPRKPADWGTLRAWAWGASRAIDYFESDKDIDAKRIGMEGLSRYGKAAIVTMAFEPRVAIGFIGSSGAGGVKILRRIYGEQVENLASSAEYHWFAGNFIKYAGPLTPNDLPVDAHALVSLCAPRPVFISSGSPHVEGRWVDAKGMFLGGVHAGPVYKLLGKKDLGTAEYPAEQTALTEGDIAWRQHEGGHTTGPNWPFFLAFAEKYFK